MINRRVILLLAACAFPLTAGEIPEKAERYRTMLLRKPENPVLFSRMLDAWLEEREMEGLKPELEERAKAGGAADWRLLAVFHEHAGDEAAAIRALDEAVKRSPDDAAARLARGKALGVALKFDAALEDLAVAANDPELAVEAGTLRGKLLARAGRPAEAVKAWQELIAANPADEGLKEDLIELEIGEGMLEEAITAARELAEKTDDPYKKALRRLQVAEIKAQAGKKAESLEEYTDVFSVSADGSWLEREVLARVGALFLREDDPEGLKDFLGGLRESYPRRVAVKKEAAKAMLATGDHDGAIAMFREVLKVMPGNREVREEFIGLLEGAERYQDAADELTSLLEIAAQDAALWERLAAIRRQLQDDAGVTAALEKALALMPEDESGQVARARLLERYEKLDDAEKILREAVASHGKSGEAAEALAGYLVARDKGDDAVALWREMAAAADREGLLRIARSLAAHGKPAEAYGLLAPRAADFPDDPLLLAALCQAAQLTDEPESAVPHALALVKLAKSPTDLESSLRLAGTIISRTPEPRKWLDALAARDDLTLSERCLLADLHETLGDSIAAEKVLKEAMAGDDSLLAANQRVRLHEIRGDIDQAVASLREMMALPGGMKTAHVKRLVELLERSGDYDAAMKATDEWLKLAPGDRVAWVKRADLFLGEGRPVEAVAEIRRALAKFGGDEELREKLADAQREAGMMEEAWKNFTALYDEAESPSAKLKWAAVLARMAAVEGKEEELIADFRRRSRDNPSSPLPLLALADMYREWQLPDEELKCVAEASRRKPDDTALQFRMADLQEGQGNPDAAAGILRGLLGTTAAPEARRRISALWIRQGEVDRGLRELTDGGAIADPRVTERLLMPLAVGKEWDALCTLLARETAAHPADWRLAYFHAVALQQAGKVEEALDRFALLLEADGELASPVSPGVQQGRHPMMGNASRKPQPPSRKAMHQLSSYQQQVLSFRDPQRFGYYGTMVPGEVPLPDTAERARMLSLAQLFLAGKDDEEKRPAITARLRSSHYDDLDGMREFAYLPVDELRVKIRETEVLTEEVLSFYFRQIADSSRTPEDESLLRSIVEKYATTSPKLALTATHWLPLSPDEKEAGDQLRQRFEIFQRLEDKDQQAMAYSLREIATAAQAPQDVRAAAAEQLKLRLSQQAGGLAQNWLAQEMPGYLIQIGEMDAAVEWLNLLTEAERNEKGKSARATRLQTMRSNYGWNSYSHREQNFAQVLVQSGSRLSRSLNRNRGDDGRFSEDTRKLMKLLDVSETGGGGPAINLEKLAAVAHKVQDPLDRLVIYHAASREKETAQEIAAIVADEKATADDLVIAAAFHRKDSPAQAYTLLLRARDAQDATPRRAEIEMQIVQLGVELHRQAADGVDLEPAKRAAMRLRRQASAQPEMKKQVATWLTALGLEEEATRFTAAPAGFASRAMRNSSGMSSHFMSRQNRAAEISKLVKDGKRDAAARQILGEFRRIAGTSNEEYEKRELMEIVRSSKLQPEIIERSTPPAGGGFKRRRDHALLVHALGQKDQATPLLRAVLKEAPDDMSVVSALFTQVGQEERLELVKSMARKGVEEDSLANYFVNRSQTRNGDERLDVAEAMTLLLEQLEPDFGADRNLSWANYAAKDLATTDYQESKRLRPLFSEVREGEKFDEEMSKRRAELCQRLFRAMLRHPQTAEQGFILMQGTSAYYKTPVEELDEAATHSLRLTAAVVEMPEAMNRYGSRNQMLWIWYRRGGGSSSSGGPPQGMDPGAWIARRAAAGKVLEPLSDDYLAGLSDGPLKEVITIAEAVISAPGLAGFKKWQEQSRSRAKRQVSELRWIARLATREKREEVLDAVEEFICDGLRRDSSTREHMEILTRRILAIPDASKRMAQLRRITEKVLGPEEAWPLYGKLDENIYISGIQERVAAFQVLCQGLSSDLRGCNLLVRFVARHGLRGNAVNLNVLTERGVLSAAELMDAGVFASGPEPVMLLNKNQKSSLMDVIVHQCLGNDEGKAMAEDLLKAEGDHRFWGRIIGGIIAQKPEVAYAEMDRAAAEVAKWTAPQQREFTRFVLSHLPEAPAKTKGAMQRVLKKSLSESDTDVIAEAKAYLKEGLPKNLRPHSGEDRIFPLVERLLPTDPALAAELWAACLESFRNNPQGWNSSNGGFSTPADEYAHGELLEHLSGQNVSPVDFAAFIAELDKLPGAAALGAPGLESYYLNQIISRSAKSLEAEIKKLSAPTGQSNHAGLTVVLARQAKPPARGPLAAILLSGLSNAYEYERNAELRQKSIAWVRDAIGKSSPAVADAFELGVSARTSDLDDAGKSSFRAALVRHLSDPAIPVSLRVKNLTDITKWANKGHLLEDPTVGNAISTLMEEYIRSDRNWASRQTMQLLGEIAKAKGLGKEDAARILKAYSAAKGSISTDSPEAQVVVTSVQLRLAVKNADLELIKQSVQQAGAHARGQLDLTIQLWQAGQIETAAKLIARPGEFHRGAAGLFLGMAMPDTPRFTREIESALPQWLASLDDPGQRYRMECILSCLQDAEGDSAPTVKRLDRLTAIAQRFAAEAPQPRVSRMETLAALAQGEHVEIALLPEYENLCRGLDLGTLVIGMNSNPSGTADQEERSVTECLIRRLCRLSLEKNGDASALIKQVESLQLNSGGNSEYYSREMMNRFFDFQATCLIRRIHELEGEEKKAAAKSALKLCELLLEFRQQDVQRDAIPLGILSQAAAGDGAAFDRWLAALPDDRRKRYDELRKNSGLSGSFGMLSHASFKSPDNEATRRALLTAMLTDEATLKREITHATDLSQMVDANAFTGEDIAAVVEALPEAHPMKARFTAEAAGIIGWRTTDQVERVLSIYDQADALAKAGGDPEVIAYVKAYRAIYFDHRLGKQAEGLAVAKEIKLDDLEEKERKWMEEILKKGAEKK